MIDGDLWAWLDELRASARRAAIRTLHWAAIAATLTLTLAESARFFQP